MTACIFVHLLCVKATTQTRNRLIFFNSTFSPFCSPPFLNQPSPFSFGYCYTYIVVDHQHLFMLCNLTNDLEVVCVFQRKVGVGDPGPEVTVELKHMIFSSFSLFFQSQIPLPIPLFYSWLYTHCSSVYSYSNMTHQSLRLFDFAPVCNCSSLLPSFLLPYQHIFPWWKYLTLNTCIISCSVSL